MMLGLGVLFLLAAGLAGLTGVIMLLVGAIEENKKKIKRGALFLAGGAISLLISFSLCSSMGL